MLSKKHRLAKTRDIQAAFARGRSFFNAWFAIKYLKSSPVHRRFTVVVSTKVSKKATLRNRLKRVIREFVRLHLEEFLPGDYAVTVKPAAAQAEAQELRDSFAKLVAAARLLKS